jgi:hypothetical protein
LSESKQQQTESLVYAFLMRLLNLLFFIFVLRQDKMFRLRLLSFNFYRAKINKLMLDFLNGSGVDKIRYS